MIEKELNRKKRDRKSGIDDRGRNSGIDDRGRKSGIDNDRKRVEQKEERQKEWKR